MLIIFEAKKVVTSNIACETCVRVANKKKDNDLKSKRECVIIRWLAPERKIMNHLCRQFLPKKRYVSRRQRDLYYVYQGYTTHLN